METGAVPQPALERMVEPTGHPLVVGVVPGQDPLVVRTAAAWARAVGAPHLHLAYVDVTRYVVQEYPDGSVAHMSIRPAGADDAWRVTRDELRAHAAEHLAGQDVVWRVHYLAGRPDRALTHLARAVDASAFVVGSGSGRLRELVDGSIALRLAHHQHRPVLTVPLRVVDWKDPRAPWQR
ncbi:universal stress protein [Cellulomonas sp. KH9]|uniref:universal stress protein n=1 Tax=Cellulomonas sp. KH9 TaxID=1855324 RepID=UPI0008F0A2FF|nr:universal stress protein [Cellulomonas sp. KH9]SFK43805.1 Nucleotide-binding universal stress protein, UspA family [Cellulomonas sp. KH9]